MKNSFKTKLVLLTFLLVSLNKVTGQSITLPYSTGFDTQEEKAGWQTFHTGTLGTSSWGYQSFGAFSAPSCVYHDYNVGGSELDTVVDWFVSPAINFTPNATITLFIQNAGFSSPFPDSFELWFSSTNPNPSSSSYELIGNLSYMLPLNQWLDTTFTIPFSSQNGYIALKYKTIGASWFTPSFDNIIIEPDASQSIEKSPIHSELKLFPNPASSHFQLFNIPVNSTDIRIIDCAGREICHIPTENKSTITIPRNNTPAGIYFVQVYSSNQRIKTQKLIFY